MENYYEFKLTLGGSGESETEAWEDLKEAVGDPQNFPSEADSWSGDNDTSSEGTESAKYMSCSGSKCPKCESEKLDLGKVQTDSNYAWRSVDCEDCGAEWKEHFSMTHIEMQ